MAPDGGVDPRGPAWGSRADVHDTLVLVYNMACPLKCDFCCHAVEDYGPQKMKAETAIDWIRQAGAAPSCNLVVFTGGEPFLYYEDLLHILRETQETGLKYRIVTAAHWATSYEAALAKLAPLAELGLFELSVSTDPSHQEWVPAKYAENAVRAALELGIIPEFASVFWDPDQCVEDTVDVPVGALTVRHFAIPVGRSKNAKVTPEDYRVGPERFLGCGSSLSYDATVYPNGEVYPCCSGGFNIQAELSFGNLFEDSLAEILERMHADRYTRLTLEIGLGPIYELAELRFPEVHAQLPDQSPHVSLCQICAIVHSDQELMKTLEPVLAYADQVFATLREMQQSVAPREHAATTLHP